MARPKKTASSPAPITGTTHLPADMDQFIHTSIKAQCEIKDSEWTGDKEAAIWLGAPRLPEVRYDAKAKDISHDTITHPEDRQLVIVVGPETVTIVEREDEIPLVRIGYDMNAKCTIYVRGDVYDAVVDTEDYTEMAAAFRRKEYGL